MVAGLKFLSKKSFNPQNLTNQKNVWERQQQEKKEDRRIRERNEQLIRERDDEELAKARGDTVKLDFLYAAPPGMLEAQKESTTAANDDYSDQEDDRKLPATDPNDMMRHRQPGDDDAAAAFRLLLARPADEGDDWDGLATGDGADAAASKSRYALQGSSSDVTKTKANLTALEKAVGRKKDSSNAITLNEQVQRFPALANAPRAQGMTSMDIGVSFKPLGTQIRNVRCMACQKWGHSKGDRDCEQQWDPFSGRASTMITQTKTKQQEEEQEKEEDRPLGGSDVHRSKRRRDRCDSSSSSEDSDSSSEESRRERRKRKERKKHEDKAKRRKDSKHRKRSKSEDSEDQERSRRRKSHKRHRKSDSRHDKV